MAALIFTAQAVAVACTAPVSKLAESKLLVLRGGTEHSENWSGFYAHDGRIEASKKHMRAATVKESDHWVDLKRTCSEASADQTAPGVEAAMKLISNHVKIVADLTNPYGCTQAHIDRLPVEALAEADACLAEVGRRLLGASPSAKPSDARASDIWVRACSFLDRRLQVDEDEAPGRAADMSPAAGAALRAALQQVAAQAAAAEASA